MRVRLIKLRTILEFVENHSDAESGFSKFVSILSISDWETPLDIVRTFNSADILGNSSNRVVFNIGGNKYRVICSYYFGRSKVHLYVNWIGSHSDYNELCKIGDQYDVEKY